MTTQTFSTPDLVRTDRGPFGLPKGLSGRLAGRLMAANDSQQRELAELIRLPGTGSLCEVGYGPGVLLRLLRARFPDAALCGVDPSSVMLRQASRATADTPMDLRCAAVADLPFDDDMFDMTVSINTVQFWPDLTAGMAEIRRVTRPGGTVLIGWHGGSAPTRIQRRLMLSDEELAGIASAISDHVGEAHHDHLSQSELFTAVVRTEGTP
jgi:SAM-dependent methyltransferase